VATPKSATDLKIVLHAREESRDTLDAFCLCPSLNGEIRSEKVARRIAQLNLLMCEAALLTSEGLDPWSRIETDMSHRPWPRRRPRAGRNAGHEHLETSQMLSLPRRRGPVSKAKPSDSPSVARGYPGSFWPQVQRLPARLQASCASFVGEVVRDIFRQTGSHLRRPGIVDGFQKRRHESISQRLSLACTALRRVGC
jgi:hypothetical protein